jgi:RNA polymerase sigma-70 factor, ECF subfamily
MTNVAATDRPAREDLDAALEQYRVELRGYCYRMLGSGFEAEDAVQETMVRAWKSFDRFEGRSSLRSWLYRIATNVSLDMLQGRKRRALPMDFGPSSTGDANPGVPLAESTWVEPIPDGLALQPTDDPAELAASRDTIRVAFVAALQHLPPRQRAVLILREVLRWKADEVAELLETSVPSVNSALQRARSTLAASGVTDGDAAAPRDEAQQQLLDRYVDAFERYDIESLVSLLHEDATMSMPPYQLWLETAADLGKWMLGGGADCRGSRLVPTMANGRPAFGQWRPSGPGGTFEPWCIHVLEISDGRISGITYFVDAKLFPMFGLPETLEP